MEIHISPLKEKDCQHIMDVCANQIESIESLLEGQFPSDLETLLIGSRGLFPNPKEISFQCSCPDWAIMCKHVAAVLYGIGHWLDENPFLLFTLRGLDLTKFINTAIGNKVDQMLEHANDISNRCLKEECVHDLFGI